MISIVGKNEEGINEVLKIKCSQKLIFLREEICYTLSDRIEGSNCHI